jgi:hypothetical protein
VQYSQGKQVRVRKAPLRLCSPQCPWQGRIQAGSSKTPLTFIARGETGIDRVREGGEVGKERLSEGDKERKARGQEEGRHKPGVDEWKRERAADTEEENDIERQNEVTT